MILTQSSSETFFLSLCYQPPGKLNYSLVPAPPYLSKLPQSFFSPSHQGQKGLYFLLYVVTQVWFGCIKDESYVWCQAISIMHKRPRVNFLRLIKNTNPKWRLTPIDEMLLAGSFTCPLGKGRQRSQHQPLYPRSCGSAWLLFVLRGCFVTKVMDFLRSISRSRDHSITSG